MLNSTQIKKIVAEARPLIEQGIDLSEKMAGLREVVTAAGGDWSQLKALVKAQIMDERDEAGEGKRVRKILDKADYAQGYADMLGLAPKMNEKNSFADEFDAETGEIIEPHSGNGAGSTASNTREVTPAGEPHSASVSSSLLQDQADSVEGDASLDAVEGVAPLASFAPLPPQPYEAGLPEATASGSADVEDQPDHPSRQAAGSNPAVSSNSEASCRSPADPQWSEAATREDAEAGASDPEPLQIGNTDALPSGAATRKDAEAAAPVHYNPDTHFLNSRNLERLHGCQNPEQCGSSQPRAKLCFSCSVKHDGPTHQPVEERA